MIDQLQDRQDAALWAAALAAFIGGDVVTTSYGLGSSDEIEEAHPIADAMMEAVGEEQAMIGGKVAVSAVAFGAYLYALRHPETREFASLFPIVLLLIGLGITTHNVRVIASVQ